MRKPPSEDVIERMTRASEELLKTVVATDDTTSDAEDSFLVQGDVDAMMKLCERMAQDAKVAVDTTKTLETQSEPEKEDELASEMMAPGQFVEEVVVEAIDEDEPSWIERKLGPWAARHRQGLHVWLLSLLALYVTLFASMIVQDGLRGLSERTATANVRDLIWAVLMGLVVLLAIGKKY